MTDDKLAAFLADLEAKAAAATPGKWWHERPEGKYYGSRLHVGAHWIEWWTGAESDPSSRELALDGNPPRSEWGEYYCDTHHENAQDFANMEFVVANSPEVVRALVAVAKAAQEHYRAGDPDEKAESLEEERAMFRTAIGLIDALAELRRVAEAPR